MDHLAYVMQRLRSSEQTLKDIAAAAGLKERWVGMMFAGEIPEPGYHKVEKLYRYFRRTNGRS